jgi:hypothetical protein
VAQERIEQQTVQRQSGASSSDLSTVQTPSKTAADANAAALLGVKLGRPKGEANLLVLPAPPAVELDPGTKDSVLNTPGIDVAKPEQTEAEAPEERGSIAFKPFSKTFEIEWDMCGLLKGLSLHIDDLERSQLRFQQADLPDFFFEYTRDVLSKHLRAMGDLTLSAGGEAHPFTKELNARFGASLEHASRPFSRDHLQGYWQTEGVISEGTGGLGGEVNAEAGIKVPLKGRTSVTISTDMHGNRPDARPGVQLGRTAGVNWIWSPIEIGFHW